MVAVLIEYIRSLSENNITVQVRYCHRPACILFCFIDHYMYVYRCQIILGTGLGGLVVIKIYLLATPFSVYMYHQKIGVSQIVRK